MTQDELKQAVARAAIAYVVENEIIGVGTGSTANFFIDELAKMKDKIKGTVASSEATAARLRGHGIPVFDLNDVIKGFNDAFGKVGFYFQIGQAEALKAIGKVRAKDGEARLLVRVACAIGASDGRFDEKERAACRLICLELGLSPADFELEP